MASRHLLNPLAPLDQPTPSSLDGVPEELERDLRACEYSSVRQLVYPSLNDLFRADGGILIQQVGVMLKA